MLLQQEELDRNVKEQRKLLPRQGEKRSQLHRRQPALPLEFATASTAASFVVGHSNVQAWECLTQRESWPTLGLILMGPASCGKTHLGAIWATRMGAHWCEFSTDVSALPDFSPYLVIDTQDYFEAAQDKRTIGQACESLFHYLAQQEAGGGRTLLIIRNLAEAGLLPDLTSRLKAMTLLSIMEPDDAVLSGMLDKLLRDFGASVHPDAPATAARLMSRSGAVALKLAYELNEASLAAGRRITPRLVREVLRTD